LGTVPGCPAPHTINVHEGRIICSVCASVDLLGMKLARIASLYQLDGILEGCRPVKAMLKGFTDQRVR
jgi:hypothetical protein